MNAEWAERWCRAMSSGDVARALAFYSDDVQFEDVPFQMQAAGPDFLSVMKHFVGSGNNAFSFLRFNGGPGGGAVESIWRARHSGEFLGADAAGQTTEVRLVTVLAFDSSGLISRHCDYWDGRTVLAQLS